VPDTTSIEHDLQALAKLHRRRRDIEEYLEDNARAAKVRELRDHISLLEGQIAQEQLLLREQELDTYQDLDTVTEEIAATEERIKENIRALPDTDLAAGLRLEADNTPWQVTSSRIQVDSSYSDGLLVQCPELRTLEVDGDPVVRQVIDADLVDRLVAQGDLTEDVVAPFKRTSRRKHPQIRIKELSDE